MPAIDHFAHVAEEEREDQRADVRAVDVGVGHDDDLVVAEFGDIEIAGADTGTEGRDHQADFLGGQHLVETRALDVEDLALERKHCLESAIASLLRGAAGRITFDEVDLAETRIALLAIGELARQRRGIERAFATRQVASLARRFACTRGLDDLLDDPFDLARVLFEELAETLSDDLFDPRFHVRGDELVFRLRGEFRIADLDADDGGESFADVVAFERQLQFLQHAGFLDVLVHRPGQRAFEADEVRAAVEVLDRVGEAEDVFGIAFVPLQRNLDPFTVALVADEDRVVVQRRLVLVQILHERDDAAFVAELVMLLRAVVVNLDVHAGVEERQLAQALRERVVVHLGDGEDRRIRFEHDARAAFRRFLAALDRRDRNAALVSLTPDVAVAMDLELEPFGQEVDDRNADAVQTARHFVRVVVELTAGMELGHDDFGGGAIFFFVQVDRNAAAVVLDGDRIVEMDRHRYAIRVAGEGFVDRIVDDLVHHVMQTGDVIGVTDVHARAFAYGIESFEDFDVFSGVGCVGRIGRGFCVIVGHREVTFRACCTTGLKTLNFTMKIPSQAKS